MDGDLPKSWGNKGASLDRLMVKEAIAGKNDPGEEMIILGESALLLEAIRQCCLLTQTKLTTRRKCDNDG
jgi:hypothetical protein